MPRPPILRIVEVFASLQGEGLRQGEPTLFIRFAGCNLRCAFCDTKYAWKGGTFLAVDEIMERVRQLRRKFPADWVSLTGGEPLLQDVSSLVRSARREGLNVQIETNGLLYQPLAVDWYTVSPKPARYSFRREYKRRARELKLIVTRDLTFDILLRLRRDFPESVPLLLQPQSLKKWSIVKGLRLLTLGLRAGLPNLRLTAQAHKVLGIR